MSPSPREQVLVGVACFVLLRGEDNQLRFLIGERIGSLGANTLALPGGHFEMFEEFADCAAREVLEETNLVLRKQDIKMVTATNNIMQSVGRHYVTLFMKCQIDSTQALNVKSMEPDKLKGDWQWMTLKELQETKQPLFLPLQNFIQEQDLSFLV